MAAQSGAGSNVQAGTITVLTTPIPGVDLVINAAPMAGGDDPESDAALRARFTLYINRPIIGHPQRNSFRSRPACVPGYGIRCWKIKRLPV